MNGFKYKTAPLEQYLSMPSTDEHDSYSIIYTLYNLIDIV
ncbi:hypothetical protein AOT82_1481 [Psychrobacter sp. AntiMn-1]|nr:hypothetical protein AOT82_1481 [Psychrobacter sp. AntiMn-1]